MVTASEMRRRHAEKSAARKRGFAARRFDNGGAVLSDADVGLAGGDDKSAPILAELSKLSEMKPERVSQGRAALEGALSGASANWRDEIYGASNASGLPEWMGGFRAPVGAARLAYESLTGEPGEATQAYEAGKDKIRGVQKAAQEDYPLTYGASNVAGALATVPLTGGASTAATLPGRMAQGAAFGAGYGALSGAGEGEGTDDRLAKGATGAVIGGLVGGAAPPVLEGAGKLIGMGTDAVRNVAGTLTNPEGEAARRVASALNRDVANMGGFSLTPQEAALARSTGQDLRIADLGGETTRALARSAANTSPTARETLNNLINPRFEGQGLRAAELARDLVSTPVNATASKDMLQNAARSVQSPLYRTAYKAGSGGIWNDELHTIANSAFMQPIMKDAALSLESKVAVGRASNPLSANGTPTLEFWDQVKRTLDSKINVAKRAGDNELAGDLSAVRSRIIDAADKATIDPKTGVSAYQTARGVASEFFKASDAVEAGEKFFSSAMKNNDARKAIMRMGPEEKAMFAEGYASALYNKIKEMPDNRNIVNSLFNNPASRERIEMALGKPAAQKMETFLHTENVVDRLRQAMGNSQTVRQLAEMGMAGGLYGYGTNDMSWGNMLSGALFWKGARAASGYAINAAQRKTAEEVARLLTSNDPALLSWAITKINRTPALRQSLLRSSDYLTRAVTNRATDQSAKAPQSSGANPVGGLPSGFTIDQPNSGGGLPPGFTIDKRQAPAFDRNKPFEPVASPHGGVPSFDPNKPFETLAPSNGRALSDSEVGIR